jgi:hypothetical protein
MLDLQPFFLASLMFFAALLSALLGCRPSNMALWAKYGDGSPAEDWL